MFQYVQARFHILVVTGLGKQRVYCFSAFMDIVFGSFSRCLFPDSKSIYGSYPFWESLQLPFLRHTVRIFLRSDVELCIYAALDMIRLAGYHKFWEAMGIHYEINPEYSLEGLMLKLKLQYFGHLM